MATIALINLTTRQGQNIEFDNGVSITQNRTNVVSHRFGNGAMRQTIKGTRPVTHEISGSITGLTDAEVTTFLTNANNFGVLPNYITYSIIGVSRKFIVDGNIDVSHISGNVYRVSLKLIEVFY